MWFLPLIYSCVIFVKNSLESGDFCSGEHTGTHVDAPAHYARNVWRLHQIPVERFIRPAIKYNINEVRQLQEGDIIAAHDLQAISEKVGLPPRNSILVIETGWWRRANNATTYVRVAAHHTSVSLCDVHKDM